MKKFTEWMEEKGLDGLLVELATTVMPEKFHKDADGEYVMDFYPQGSTNKMTSSPIVHMKATSASKDPSKFWFVIVTQSGSQYLAQIDKDHGKKVANIINMAKGQGEPQPMLQPTQKGLKQGAKSDYQINLDDF